MAEAATAPRASGNGAATGNLTDPFRGYNFRLDVGGADLGHFTEVSGLGARVQAISYREGGRGQVVRRIPGRVEYADVTLRYGVTSSQDLWNWFLASLEGKVQRKHVSIFMLDADGTTDVVQWDLESAWPSEWRAAPLDASGREVAVESMTLVFETLKRLK